MAVVVPIISLENNICYFDNIIKVFLGITEIIKQHAVLALLVLHVSMRPLANDKPAPRKETLSLPEYEMKTR